MILDLCLGTLSNGFRKWPSVDTPITYSSIFERLKYFMRTLGLEDGETPRSLRAGCLVTLAFSMLILDS